MYDNIFTGKPLRPIGARDVAYEQLRHAIITNRLAAGARLYEERLARELGVSRTPLREALKVLESEGFAERLISGGYQVAALSEHELDNLYSIRIELEGLAARRAAQHADGEACDAIEEWNEHMRSHWLRRRHDDALQAGRSFHAAIHTLARNENLAMLLQRLGDQISRYRYYSIVYRVLEAYEDHRAIVAALRAHDATRAEALLRTHVAVEHQLVLQKMRERTASDDAPAAEP
jgi:DNA-binding GntR family transcriptional regulator